MIKVIVFDFDGVLVDSNQMKKDVFLELFDGDAKVQAVAREVLSSFWQKTRYEALFEIFTKLCVEEKSVLKQVSYHNERYNKMVTSRIGGLGLTDGVYEALKSLQKKYHLYINSATPTDPLKKTAEDLGIDGFFKGILGVEGFDTILNSKKKNLKKIFDAERARASEVLFVGDGEADLAAAGFCKCHFIGIANATNGWGKKEKWRTIDSVAELPEFLRSNQN